MYKITSDFNMRSVDNGKLRSDFLDERNETRHLRVICQSKALST